MTTIEILVAFLGTLLLLILLYVCFKDPMRNRPRFEVISFSFFVLVLTYSAVACISFAITGRITTPP